MQVDRCWVSPMIMSKPSHFLCLAHEIIEGLEGTRKGGTRYPITAAMGATSSSQDYFSSSSQACCLRACRSPLGFLMSDWRDGLWGAWHMGMRHGVCCLGCCWALMALLFVGGVHEPALDCCSRRSRSNRKTCAQGRGSRSAIGRRNDLPGSCEIGLGFAVLRLLCNAG